MLVLKLEIKDQDVCVLLSQAHYIPALGGAQIRFYDKSMQKEVKEFQKVCILFLAAVSGKV